MSVLEIILYIIIGLAVLYLIGSTIYDIKHPDKAKERKQKKLEKQKQKQENAEKNKHEEY